MKKATLEAIRTALLETIPDTDLMIVELDAEINKGAEEKAARAAEYESVHDLIVDNLSDMPVTVADLYAEIESDLPDNFSKNKVQYALNNLWTSEIKKIPGKPNTYVRA